MARPLRLEFAGVLYYVTSRGDGREDIYLEDEDRSLFLKVLEGVRSGVGSGLQGGNFAATVMGANDDHST